MEELCQAPANETSLMDHHSSALKEAETRFRELVTLGDEGNKEDFLRQLQRECEDAFGSIKERKEGQKTELLRKLESSVNDIALAYKRGIQQVPIKEESDFRQLESVQRQLAYEQFDKAANFLCFAEIMRPDRDRLKTKLRIKLDEIYKDVQIYRGREKWALRLTENTSVTSKKNQTNKKKDECDQCMNKILNDFRRNVKQHEGIYVDNLKTILENLKRGCLKKYDEKMASNSEREYVGKNKEVLQREIKFCVTHAIMANEYHKVRAAIGAIISYRITVFKQFQLSVDKYEDQYYENLERLLFEEKSEKLRAFDEKLKWNTESNTVLKNREIMLDEMDRYIREAFLKNENQRVT